MTPMIQFSSEGMATCKLTVGTPPAVNLEKKVK